MGIRESESFYFFTGTGRTCTSNEILARIRRIKHAVAIIIRIT